MGPKRMTSASSASKRVIGLMSAGTEDSDAQEAEAIREDTRNTILFYLISRSRSRDRRYRSRSRSYRRDYPRDEGCFKCGKTGHIKRNCPEMRSFGRDRRSRSPSYRRRDRSRDRSRDRYRREERKQNYSSNSRSRERDYRKRRSPSRSPPRNPER